MSPEQIRGEKVNARTDMFSFGVVLYEMISGRQPFISASVASTIPAILSEEPAPLARYANDVPEELQRIVRKCLEKDREERYQSAREVSIDLSHLRKESDRAPISEKQARAITAKTSRAHNIQFPPYALAAAVLLIVAVAVAGIYWLSTRGKAINSVAVLPFANANADPDTDYLSDGITDSLIDGLAELPNLKVMSRNSVFRYKGKETDAKAVGKELGVAAVLSGRLWQRGDNISINVELVDANDNSHLWGQRYDRKLSDLLALQSEIAEQISQQLRVKLTGEEQRRVTKSYTASTEAYQLYLKGRYYWYKFSEDDFKRALDYFQQAIDKDPNYALAYAGMADCYWQLGWYNYLPKKEAWPKARAAIEKALERDKTVAGAHTSLATWKAFVDLDYNGGEAEFKQALNLNSNDGQTHMQYSWHLDSIGQVDKAIEEAKKAHELDPLSPEIAGGVAQALFYARRYDEAIEVYQQTLSSDPNAVEHHAYLGSAFEQKRMYDDAISEFQKAGDSRGEKPGIGMLGHAYAVSGRTNEARKVLDQLMKEAPARSYALALIYTGLGDKDSAFAWLNKTFDDEDLRNQLVFIKVDPTFDNLRSDQRFVELLRRMKLPT